MYSAPTFHSGPTPQRSVTPLHRLEKLAEGHQSVLLNYTTFLDSPQEDIGLHHLSLYFWQLVDESLSSDLHYPLSKISWTHMKCLEVLLTTPESITERGQIPMVRAFMT